MKKTEQKQLTARELDEKAAGKKESDEKDQYGISYEEDFFSCSSTDCTGLIPAGIVSDAEREFYKELYPSLTPIAVSHEKK